MKREHRQALVKLRRVARDGAPFTRRGHPLHAILCEMAVYGIVRGRVVDDQIFWFETK